MRTETTVLQARRKQDDVTSTVCQLLAISQKAYCWHQYRQYERFCEIVTAEAPHLLNRLRYSDVFRGFWNNDWTARNIDRFMPIAYDCKYELLELRAEYISLHAADNLLYDEGFYKRFESVLKSI